MRMSNTPDRGDDSLISRMKGVVESIRGEADAETPSRTGPAERLSGVSQSAGMDASDQFNATQFRLETGLTPREYVCTFLEAQGGRCRQQLLACSLEWSDSTVSRLLSEMETDGAVVTVSIGRENIVCLPDATFE